MPQYFTNSECIPGESVSITGKDYHHLTHVRRVRTGDGVYLRDANGDLYAGWIARIDEDSILVEVASRCGNGKSSPEIILGMSLLKGSNFDLVVQKAVEVGVSSIVPLVTERTIVELKGKDNEKRERWRKIAEEASKQSMRDSLPVVEHPMTFDDFLKAHADVPVRIITAPGERDYTLRSALEQQKGNRAALLVGPEGGFSADEILRAEAAGFICVVVGSTQMRAETAGIVLPALLRYELEARFGDER